MAVILAEQRNRIYTLTNATDKPLTKQTYALLRNQNHLWYAFAEPEGYRLDDIAITILISQGYKVNVTKKEVITI